jgi:hypothetical protein
MIDAEFVFGGLEAIFNRPTTASDSDECLDVGAGRAPGREVGQVTVADVTADQQDLRISCAPVIARPHSAFAPLVAASCMPFRFRQSRPDDRARRVGVTAHP